MAKFILKKDYNGRKAGDEIEVAAVWADLLLRGGIIDAIPEKKIPAKKAETK